jgi:hypothetical protein
MMAGQAYHVQQGAADPEALMSEATPEVSWDQPVPTLRTHTPTAEVETLLDDSFAADYHRCTCGAMIVTAEDQCYPCGQGQRDRGPIYGASLAGHTPAPGDALRAIDAVWGTSVGWPEQAEVAAANTCHDCDAMATWNTKLLTEITSLRDRLAAAQTTLACHDCAAVADASEALQRELDTVTEYCLDVQDTVDALNTENSALAGQVVALKGQLYEAQCALTRAEERVSAVSKAQDTLVETVTQQANRLAACTCGA